LCLNYCEGADSCDVVVVDIYAKAAAILYQLALDQSSGHHEYELQVKLVDKYISMRTQWILHAQT
jgi:hypothetical protein